MMHPVRQRRLLTIIFIVSVLAIAAALIMYALRQNISLFYTPTQIANHEAPKGQTIRVGGMVVKGSVIRSSKDLEVSFVLTDFAHQVTVKTTTILPDLFREGQGIIAKGRLTERSEFIADEVLAKHDENYMPPEVKEALEKGKSSGAAL